MLSHQSCLKFISMDSPLYLVRWERELRWKCGSVFVCIYTLMRFTYVSGVDRTQQTSRGRGGWMFCRSCVTQRAQKSHCPHLRSADVLLSFSGEFHTHQVQRGFWRRRQGCRQRALTAVSVKPKSSWTYFTAVVKRWGKDALALCER